ncbi:hypothetical protein AVEN_227652-1 [Araneus ventricosus]|uniref:Uncharacterized protein n=1 Tax=Araneus ventricosus TaxID=182803 RepID=A0A4Y2RV39_ARAVE|nr:hypothetical protein AVEN_227652-1 [Araneus ventricosus]
MQDLELRPDFQSSPISRVEIHIQSSLNSSLRLLFFFQTPNLKTPSSNPSEAWPKCHVLSDLSGGLPRSPTATRCLLFSSHHSQRAETSKDTLSASQHAAAPGRSGACALKLRKPGCNL